MIMLKDVIKVSLLQKGQNDRIKNITSVFYDIQCSLNNCELSATMMTNSSPDHNTSTSKTVGLVNTLVRKTFPTLVVHMITSIAKMKCKSGFVTEKDELPGVKAPTTACTSPGLSRDHMVLFKDWSYHRTPSYESRNIDVNDN